MRVPTRSYLSTSLTRIVSGSKIMGNGDKSTSEFRKIFFRFPSSFLKDAMSKRGSEIYIFGPFRLDVGEHNFERLDGSPNGPLPEKAFQTLTALLRNRGNLVTKDELINAVWPDTVVEENNLDKAIHAIRNALGEKRGEQNYIETVRKHGFRFVGDVVKIEATPATALDKRRSSTKWLLGLLLLLTVLAATVSVIYLTIWKGPSPATRSLFVLPIQPIGTGNQNDALLELGIADAIINRLASSDTLVLRSLHATREHAATVMDPVEAGRRQNVDYVLAANYQIAEGKIRVTSQLINVATGAVEGSFKHESEFRSLFGVQDTVASEIGTSVLRALGLQGSRLFADRGTSNESAYRAYLEGMYHYDQRSRERAEMAVVALTNAVQLDPNYADAWAGKAHAHLSAAGFGRDSDINGQNEQAKYSIDQALKLDKNLANAYSARCLLALTYDYDLAAAEPDCKRAIEIDPNSGIAHQVYSRVLTSAGRFDDGIAEIKTAIDLEPASVFNQRLLGMAYHYARRYNDAAEQLKRVVAMDSRGPTIMWLTLTLAFAGHEAEAFDLWIKHRGASNENEQTEWNSAFAREGWKGVMRLRAHRFENDNVLFAHGAGFNAYVGDSDKAFEYLEESYRRREAYLPYVRVDPRFDPIRDDPRFETFLKKIGF